MCASHARGWGEATSRTSNIIYKSCTPAKIKAFGPTHVQQDKQHKDERSWKLVMQPHQAPTTHLVIFKQLFSTKIAQTYFLELKRSLRELLRIPLIEAKERYPQLYVPPMPAHLRMPPDSLDLAGNLLIRVIINSAKAKGQKISIEVFGHSAGSFVGIWLCNRILAGAEEQMFARSLC